MAEVLGVVASSISVGQLAVDLLGCLQRLRNFYQAIQNIPEDLQQITQQIEILGEIFSHVGTSNRGDLASLLKASLAKCQTAALNLETKVTAISKPLNQKRRWQFVQRVKAVLKKPEIKELKILLDEAKDLLQLALVTYEYLTPWLAIFTDLVRKISISQDLSVALPRHDPPLLVEETPKTPSSSLSSTRTAVQTRRRSKALNRQQYALPTGKPCFLDNCCCSCHQVSSIQGRYWSLKFPAISKFWTPCSTASCGNAMKASLWISLTKIGCPWAVSATLNVMWNSQHSYISPSLDFQRVVRFTSPGFKVLWELQSHQRDDWATARDDLLALFDSGEASPRDIDPEGKTWLEKVLYVPWGISSRDIQYHLLFLLIEKGTQINTLDLLYRVMKWIGEGPHMDIWLTLLSRGFDPSETEAPVFQRLPTPCNPNWFAEDITEDPFFVEWIAEGLKVCPGFFGMSLFLEAILIESTEEVERRLRKCSVSDQDNLLGQSALHLAVSRPQHLQLLLDSGADVNAIDKHEITPLMYAGALGKTKVAIKLLEAGANLWLVDSLHKRHFLFYATARVHWDTIMDILNWTLNHRELPSEARRWWTTTVLLFWSNDYQWRRRPEDLSTLLKWGADPNVLYISDEVTNKTVLCGIQDAAELGILVSHGFNKFDHKDSRGKHAHIILARECKPVLLQMCIDGGSTINHQDETGHSSLHIVVQHLRQQLIILSERDDHHYYGQRSDTIDCVKLLLRSGADPFVHDDCQCYCSKSGCTPLHFILKETSCREFNFGKDIWALELLDAIREQGDFDISKQSLLQMLHLLKFEEIELTHTCCRSSIFMSMEPKLSKDEIEEIMDEEKELAMVLDQEMEQLEKAIGDSLELHLLKALFKLQCRIQEESEKCLQPTNPPVRRLSSADKFCPKRVDHNHLGEIFTL